MKWIYERTLIRFWVLAMTLRPVVRPLLELLSSIINRELH
ncbi:hypothetical protein PEDI_19300 [Persicobacter diffluens]|uniref:Uncharacterized protein n=1 Tax=Persicobacter diffluens TaxID=981 RepID=A0AAN5ALZ4_9BACT|nr:hypothetical protein PEDI_19300 [Persicobacter diffluens]